MGVIFMSEIRGLELKYYLDGKDDESIIEFFKLQKSLKLDVFLMVVLALKNDYLRYKMFDKYSVFFDEFDLNAIKKLFTSAELKTIGYEFLNKMKARSEMIAQLPDDVIPMDFHLHEIRIGDDCLEVEVDYIWNIFAVSYSGSKAVVKKFKEISRDLYSYYGVTEEDIKNKTERYSALVTELSS